jgi:excisionase family DNA binding protein
VKALEIADEIREAVARELERAGLPDVDRFVSITEAARRLEVSRATAYAMVRDGSFPVPVRSVRGKSVVSLRALAEHIYGAPIANALPEAS